ncbi:MAG: hypothetical protein IPH09_03485 [bacterium]|nr:hypothetical protein [bacterium]
MAGRLDALSEYLGMELSGSSDVDPKHARVVRTKSSGDWRHWFRPTDAGLFRTIYEDFLIRYGYDTDWTPHASPRIEPQFASEYFYRLVSGGLARPGGKRCCTARSRKRPESEVGGTLRIGTPMTIDPFEG